MSNLRRKLPKWTTVLLGDSYTDRGGGGGGGAGGGAGGESSVDLLTLDSERPRQQPNPFSSVWKPVWYTGWHTGVLACTTCVVVVLLINVGLTIYAATNSQYKMERGTVTLYSGSCEKSRELGLWLHLGINALSTLLLSGSNYTQQCLAAPTRSEIDAAHARRRWMDIGVPSIRNLFRIKAERAFLWIAIGITSVPLHLLYNSAVYTSLAANEFIVTFVTKNHFDPGAYSNPPDVFDMLVFSLAEWIELTLSNPVTGKKYGDIGYQTDSHDTQLFINMLEGYNASAPIYEDLELPQCINIYNTDFVSSHRNLFLITKNTSNSTHNNTLLSLWPIRSEDVLPSEWMCVSSTEDRSKCNPNEFTSKVARGVPWIIRVGRDGEEVEGEVIGCKSEITKEKCRVQFSLGIMIVVIACNLVKACCMVMTVVRAREPTLVTLGDAIDSFLRIPDPTTIGICFADRQFIKREWGRGRRTGPRKWNRRGAQRWWTSVSKTRWITCNFFCSVAIIITGVLLASGIGIDRGSLRTDIKSMWKRGFGKVNTVSLVQVPVANITQGTLLANLPQTILSFLYLTYNSLFTCMLSGHEWSLFSHHHRTLRVTSPRPGQRSTYWLQIPYTYAIPLMTLSALLHWLTSQSIFLARVDMWDPFGREVVRKINSVGYSCIAIIFALALGILALLTAAGVGCKRFAAEITTVGGCSAAISASCHAWGADSEGIIGKKVRWGDVEIVPNQRVRHLTFSSREGVRKPVFEEIYAGTGGEKE